MNKKRITLAVAAILSLTTLAACTDPDKRLDFSDYWKRNSLASESVDESLKYSVTFEKGAGLDAVNYQLNYGTGSYTSTLKSNATEYIHTTSLTISVTYQLNDETESFTDTVTSEVRFKNSDNQLQPISSTKTVVSHSPVNTQAGALADCFTAYDYTVATSYNEDGTASSKITYRETADFKADETTTPSFNYSKGDYSYLDNEQLLLSLRAASADTTSGAVKTYNPFLEAKQQVDLSFSTATSAKFTYKENGADVAKDVNYRPVTMKLNGKNSGATQTAWIATTTNPESNTFRNVMLKLETPLSYSFGKLVYTLTEFNFI